MTSLGADVGPRSGGRRAGGSYRAGLLVGGSFGLVDILVNAGVVLSSPASVVLRVVAVAAFVGLVVLTGSTRQMAPAHGSARMGVGRSFWLVVVGEVAAIGVGKAVLIGPLDAPDAVVAWISVVVGVHFLGLAAVWQAPFLRPLGVAIALCGVIGLVAAAAGSSPATVAAVAGLVPGVLLLGTSYWGSASGAPDDDPHQAPPA